MTHRKGQIYYLTNQQLASLSVKLTNWLPDRKYRRDLVYMTTAAVPGCGRKLIGFDGVTPQHEIEHEFGSWLGYKPEDLIVVEWLSATSTAKIFATNRMTYSSMDGWKVEVSQDLDADFGRLSKYWEWTNQISTSQT